MVSEKEANYKSWVRHHMFKFDSKFEPCLSSAICFPRLFWKPIEGCECKIDGMMAQAALTVSDRQVQTNLVTTLVAVTTGSKLFALQM